MKGTVMFRGLAAGIILLAAVCHIGNVKVKAAEYVFDLNDFYVSDEFLQNGTSGNLEILGHGFKDDSGNNEENNQEDISEDALEASEETMPDMVSEGDVFSTHPEAEIDYLPIGGETPLLGYSVSARKTSQEGVAMIERWEGCRLTAYKALSTEKYYTIGYGHYGADVTPGMTITQAQAEALLKQDLKTREDYLNNFLISNGILLAQNEFDAIISLIYNIGTGNFSDSTIRRYILEGFDVHTADDYTYAISMWHYSGGKSIQGLVNRRAAESALFTRYGTKRPEVKQTSLDVKGCIRIDIFIDVPSGISSVNGAYAELTTDKGTNRIYLSQASHSGQRYCFIGDFAAKDMTKTLSVAIYDASGIKLPLKSSNTGEGFSYVQSIPAYAGQAASLGDQKLNSLMNSMLEYGKVAQSYFGNGAYAGSAQVQSVSSSVFNPYLRTIAGEATGLKYMGTTLFLKSDTTIRHYFYLNGNYQISNYSFNAAAQDGNMSGANMQVGTSDGLYYVEIRNISPADYDKMFKVSVKNTTTGSAMTINYAVFSYAERVMSQDTPAILKNLVKSMYLYNKAAENYFY